jgi:hypothetical protein
MIRLTDEQWERIRDHFPEEKIADGRPARKPIPTRCVLEAVLWILNTGAQWHMLPQSYPNYKTVHRRFQTWCRDEVLRRALTDVANELRDSGALNEEECFIDATFVMAKGGGLEIGASHPSARAIVEKNGPLPRMAQKVFVIDGIPERAQCKRPDRWSLPTRREESLDHGGRRRRRSRPSNGSSAKAAGRV